MNAEQPATDAKAKFKAALDAKNARRQETERVDRETGSATVPGARAGGAKPRMFRRKAGG